MAVVAGQKAGPATTRIANFLTVFFPYRLVLPTRELRAYFFHCSNFQLQLLKIVEMECVHGLSSLMGDINEIFNSGAVSADIHRFLNDGFGAGRTGICFARH